MHKAYHSPKMGYNLLSVRALNKMGFALFLDIDVVVLLWSKTLNVAFVGYVEDDLFVVDFLGKNHFKFDVLIRKGRRGLVVASPPSPCQYENFVKSPQGWPRSRTKRRCLFYQKSCL